MRPFLADSFSSHTACHRRSFLLRDVPPTPGSEPFNAVMLIKKKRAAERGRQGSPLVQDTIGTSGMGTEPIASS
jgi:hypothetical protein